MDKMVWAAWFDKSCEVTPINIMVIGSKQTWDTQGEIDTSIEQQDYLENLFNEYLEIEQLDDCSFFYHGDDLEVLHDIMRRAEFEYSAEFEKFCKKRMCA